MLVYFPKSSQSKLASNNCIVINFLIQKEGLFEMGGGGGGGLKGLNKGFTVDKNNFCL